MSGRRNLLALIFGLLFLQSCVSVPEQADQPEASGIIIDGIRIENGLAYTVTDVMILVPATGGFAGCGNIMPRTACSNSFPDVDYRENAVVISWKEHGKPQKTDEFVVKAPEDLLPGKPAWMEVTIFAPGQAGARLIQK